VTAKAARLWTDPPKRAGVHMAKAARLGTEPAKKNGPVPQTHGSPYFPGPFSVPTALSGVVRGIARVLGRSTDIFCCIARVLVRRWAFFALQQLPSLNDW